MQSQQARVAFVRGCPRSGTTLLADVMNESPEIGLLIEMPFGDLVRRILPILWYEQNVERERAEIAAAAKRVAQAPSATGEYFIGIDNRHRVTYARRYPTRERFASIVTGVVERSMDKPGLAIVGSKTPGRWDEYDLDLVRSLYGCVKYVFVVRNPLDTINSIINRRNAGRAGLDFWPYKFVSEGIDAYYESTAQLLSCIATYGDDCYVIGYEDLLADPVTTLAGLGRFLGVELHDRTSLIEKAGPSKPILTIEEDAEVRAAFGPAIEAWGKKSLTGPGSVVGYQLDDCVRVLEDGKEYRFDAGGTDRSVLGAGWSVLEPQQGVWSEGLNADLYFRVPRNGQYVLTIEVGPYLPVAGETLAFGLKLGPQTLQGQLGDGRVVRIAAGPVALESRKAQRLGFSFSGLRSPADRGLGNDHRRLGLCLRGLTVEQRPTS